MNPICNRTVLITGAAVRIGAAIAKRFAQAGAHVIVHCNRSSQQAETLVHELNTISNACRSIPADLTDSDQRASLIPRILEEGPLDILINNASVYRRMPLEDVDEQAFLTDYTINFTAPFLLMRDFKNLCKKGSIINLLDQRVNKIDPFAATYGFAKKSLRDATEAAAVSWSPAIRVNGVAPGFVLPPPGVSEEKMKPHLKSVPMNQQTAVEEIADACLFLSVSPTVNGQILYVDGGLHLVHPSTQEIRKGDFSENTKCSKKTQSDK